MIIRNLVVIITIMTTTLNNLNNDDYYWIVHVSDGKGYSTKQYKTNDCNNHIHLKNTGIVVECFHFCIYNL